MVKVERSFPAPKSLELEKIKVNGSYTGKDVVEQLIKDFNNKCYICNLGKLTDIQIEHLKPHKNGSLKDLKFDWENLFLSCPHCNSIKNNPKYDCKVLDCCKEDPEKAINFIFEDSKIEAISKDLNNKIAITTALLITEVFNLKNTGIRENGTDIRVKKLNDEMNTLFRFLIKYNENLKHNKNNKRNIACLKELLSKKSQFASFKRSYLLKNSDRYIDLINIMN